MFFILINYISLIFKYTLLIYRVTAQGKLLHYNLFITIINLLKVIAY